MVFLLAFLVVPLLEIAVFILIGDRIGLWPTIALVVVTAVAGAALLRSQGLATVKQARACFERGEAPVQQVFDGVCLLFAGALLLTPGFLTDSIGLLLFAPPVRGSLGRRVFRYLGRHADVQVFVNGAPMGADGDQGFPPHPFPFEEAAEPPQNEPAGKPGGEPEPPVDAPDVPLLSESRWSPPKSKFKD